MEKQFAVKSTSIPPSSLPAVQVLTTPPAVQHLHTYWSILERMKGSDLRLTRLDDEIYEHLLQTFPDFDPAKPIDEDAMKSKEGKEKWRPFMMAYEKKVDDYNMGTMLRTRPDVEYEEHTTIFVPRMQFYAYEIARNRNGLNDWISEKAQKAKS